MFTWGRVHTRCVPQLIKKYLVMKMNTTNFQLKDPQISTRGAKGATLIKGKDNEGVFLSLGSKLNPAKTVFDGFDLFPKDKNTPSLSFPLISVAVFAPRVLIDGSFKSKFVVFIFITRYFLINCGTRCPPR